MSEHVWPDDHHDSYDHHDDHHDDTPEQVELDPGLPDDDVWEAPHEDHHEPEAHDDPEPEPEAAPEPVLDNNTGDDPHEMATVGADPDALPDTDDQAAVFPPAVDVGPLPEPVDGFPWIDTGSLGLVDPATVHAGTPDPGELAEYAAADLPPGVDPWAELAGSDDPATSALARFWGSPARPDQP